jgi:hypothetical protein
VEAGSSVSSLRARRPPVPVFCCPFSLCGGPCGCSGPRCHWFCLVEWEVRGGRACTRGRGVADAMIVAATRDASHPVRARRGLSLFPAGTVPERGGRGGRTVLRHSPRRAVMPRQARHVGASGGERRVLAGLQLRRDKCASSPFPALPLLSHLLLRFAPGLGSRLSLRPSLARSAETLTLKLRGLDPCPSAGLCDFGSPSSCCCALSLPNLWIWCGHVQVAAATWR